MIFRHRRAIAWSALVLVVVAAVFALPVFGELGNENDFDDPSAEAVTARNAVNRTTGAFATPSIVALVRLGAPVESAQARERIARVAAALRDPGRGVGGRLRARAATAAPGLQGRPLDLPAATFKNDPAGARPRIEERLQGVPWVDAGRRRGRRARRSATRSRPTSPAPS